MQSSDWATLIGYIAVALAMAWMMGVTIMRDLTKGPKDMEAAAAFFAAFAGILLGAAWPITLPIAAFAGSLLAVARRAERERVRR